MLRKLRSTMGDRDQRYWLKELVKVHDAPTGGKHAHGTADDKSALFAVERRGKDADYLTAQTLERLDRAMFGTSDTAWWLVPTRVAMRCQCYMCSPPTIIGNLNASRSEPLQWNQRRPPARIIR